MWRQRYGEHLRHEVEVLLASLPDVPGLYDLTREPLTKARRGLSNESACDQPWPLLPLIVCDAISGDIDRALPAAAMLQLLMAAGDVFDDIEDADSSESLSGKYGTALATNVATTLLVLAEKGIARLKTRQVEDDIIVHLLDKVNTLYAVACAGQHLDLFLSPGTTTTEDTYLKIIQMKSASQVECACYVGALLAKANQELVDKFSAFGHNLGMASQITNDIQGAIRGNDIARRKITLPVIYALAQTEGNSHHQLELSFNRQGDSIQDPASVRELLFRTGAIYYATVKIEYYKGTASDILSQIKNIGVPVEHLQLFVK